jgi:hypothetical protein
MPHMPHRKRPCHECPFVRTTPPGQFTAARYEALRSTTEDAENVQAPLGTPLFACHLTHEGRDMPCAGWLAAVGYSSIPVRVLIARGRLPSSVLQPGDDWPPLFDSYDAMAKAQGAREETT